MLEIKLSLRKLNPITNIPQRHRPHRPTHNNNLQSDRKEQKIRSNLHNSTLNPKKLNRDQGAFIKKK